MPLGVKFKNPLPLLWQHDPTKPVGTAVFDKPTEKGINFVATFPNVNEPGAVKDRVDEAYQSAKHNLVSAVSIGFRALPDGTENIKGGGIRFNKSEVLELSMVTIPANASATIQTVKSIDTEQRATSSDPPPDSKPPTEVGTVTKTQPAKAGFLLPLIREKKMNIAEQLTNYANQRAASAERMNEIMSKSAAEARTLDEAEETEYSDLAANLKKVDEHIVRLRGHEAAVIAKAVPVTDAAGKTDKGASDVRDRGYITLKSNAPKGLAFTRFVKAMAVSGGNMFEAAERAKQWTDTPEVGNVLRAASQGMEIKSAVAAGTIADSTWAGPLAQYTNLTGEFVELLRPATIIGRIPGFTRVPFLVKIPVQNSGSTVGWVGEGAAKPVGSLGFGSLTMPVTKAAGIVVITDELARNSSPSAEALVQSDLIAQMAQFLDDAFINPAHAANAGVNPAAVTNGVTPVAASGTTQAALLADFKKLVANYVAANMSLSGAVFVMTETQATALSLLLNPLGQPAFPAINANGGSLLGLPVIVSQSVPSTTSGSPAVTTAPIVLIKASDILLADDGGVAIDVSREASVQMNSAPDNPATASTVYTSLWQNNLIGVRCERFINWVKRRPGAVQYISSANYG
jgi:HK97 family phage major capsid protein/HK97 family phage prohead protease